jgi:hypothetical protein
MVAEGYFYVHMMSEYRDGVVSTYSVIVPPSRMSFCFVEISLLQVIK